MAEVLEDMGFPSEWCERALRSASGIETAVDLLLQWQAQGMPQFLPSPSPPSSSAGKGAQEQQSNSRSLASAGPTLRLLPLPITASKAVMGEGQQSPSSTLAPSTSSPCPSSLDGPSAVNDPCNSDSPSSSFPRDVPTPPGLRRNSSHGRIGPREPPVDQMAVTGISSVEGASSGPERGSGSNRKVDNLDTSDAVVPDAFADERKIRYMAARRAKQEKEDEKAKIRQHVQEDMAQRRLRHTYQFSAVNERHNSTPPADNRGKHVAGTNSSRAVSVDTTVELQIRCPGSQTMKASFVAGASLKDVRAHVEHLLQQPLRMPASQDHYTGLRVGSVPFSGRSGRLSTDRQAEKEILQAARENYELHTSRIVASAKTLRNSSGMPDTSSSSSVGTMYFLIPFPRQEFFTESAMDSTLAEAQLVPRGTLVVQYRPREVEPVATSQVQPGTSSPKSDRGNRHIDRSPCRGRSHTYAGTSGSALIGRSLGHQAMELETDEVEIGLPTFEEAGLPFDLPPNETIRSGRTLEMDGERVRVRELTLQAAARRMTEAARIFREGLPLEEGELGGGFHFPREPEHTDMDDASSPQTRKPATQRATALDSAALPEDNESLNVKAAGADAELFNTPHLPEVHHPGSDEHDRRPLDGPLDSLRRQAMAAAEARIRSSQPQLNVPGGGYNLGSQEAESRIREDELESPLIRVRTRIPQSSRLLSRPEKLQRMSGSSPVTNSSVLRETPNNAEQAMAGASSSWAHPQPTRGAGSPAGPLEAALQRYKATTESDNKGKGIVEEHGSVQMAVSSSSGQPEAERSSSLRVRLEDGNVVQHTFPANTMLESVRDLVIPEGAVASAYGFMVQFPEPRFVEGDDLATTLETVGLVPHGTIYLTKSATRGMVRQGRRVVRRRRYMEESDDELEPMNSVLRHFSAQIENNLTYEQLMDLEDSIGRVHVGVPDEVLSALPTHIVKAKKVNGSSEGATEGEEEELNLCIVCLAEMADGDEALSLPCVHSFHTVCIRKWLVQSTCCPTCKHSLA